MNNLGVGLFVLLASLVLGACKDDDDSNSNGNGTSPETAYTETAVSEAPAWQIDWSNNQERPNWTEPDFSSIYENWTILKVQIEEALQPYASKDDLMALFVNGELRGLASPAVIVGSDLPSNTKYLLKAWGNEAGAETVNMSLQYYSQTLKHLFTLTDDITLDSDETTGIDEAFIPEFTLGSAKYPVMKTVGVEPLLTKAGLTPVSGNTVAAFVGEECRGTVLLSASGSTQLRVFGCNAGETGSLKFYDATAGKLYTIPDVVKM
ncbi:MAG: hypothetical protein K6G53_09585 [Bacteroidales bacterium]|nr:hypothetical protein [Bacteroidales bacterium]